MHLLWRAGIYLGASTINKAVPLMLLPLLTRYLPPEEFGQLAIFMVANSFGVAVVGMGVAANITKLFFVSAKAEMAEVVGSACLISVSGATVVLVMLWLSGRFHEHLFSIPVHYFYLIPVVACLTTINTLNLTLLRNRERAYLFGFFEISTAIVMAGTTAVFLTVFEAGWMSQVYGYLAASGTLAVISLCYMSATGYLNFEWGPARIGSMLALSLPLIPHNIAAIVINISDRLFIESMIGLEAVAMYSIGYSFGMLPTLGVDAYIKAWSPWFYRKLVSPISADKRCIVLYTYVYIFVVFAVAIGIATLSWWLTPFIVDEAYADARSYVFWVAIGYACHGVYEILLPYLVHLGKTGFLAISSVLAAAVNLVLNYFLISDFGAIGAAYATIVAFAISAILVFTYQKRNYPMPWAWWSVRHG